MLHFIPRQPATIACQIKLWADLNQLSVICDLLISRSDMWLAWESKFGKENNKFIKNFRRDLSWKKGTSKVGDVSYVEVSQYRK